MQTLLDFKATSGAVLVRLFSCSYTIYEKQLNNKIGPEVSTINLNDLGFKWLGMTFIVPRTEICEHVCKMHEPCKVKNTGNINVFLNMQIYVNADALKERP